MKVLLVFSLLLTACFQNGSSQTLPVTKDDDAVVCHVRMVDIQEEDHVGRDEIRCVDDLSGQTFAVDLPDSVSEYAEELDEGSLYASIPRGRLARSGAGDRVVVPEGASVKLSTVEPEKKSSVRRQRSPQGRRLAQRKIGTSTVLVIRVVAADASTSLSRSELSNRVFGTSGDKVNLASVYEDCSASKLKFIPATGNNIQDGVGEVTISQSVGNKKPFDVDNFIVEAAKKKFGDLENSYDHVMLCLPPGTAGSWVAYAYRNWYRSSYNDLWCGSPSAQVHEIGHNLGLKHSMEGGETYGDTTGLMGFSYSANEGPNMCFNGHKHWILGWFNDRRTNVDPASNGAWMGKLATFVDYQSTSLNEEYVLVKLNVLYLQFNRKKGFNSGTKEKQDQVTVTKAADSNVESESLAGLGAVGDKFIYNGIAIEVCEVNQNDIPSYAQLSIYMQKTQVSRCGEEELVTTLNPSHYPIAQPSARPSPQPSPTPSRLPSQQPTTAPSNVPSVLLSSEPTSTTLTPTRMPSEEPTQQPSKASSPSPSTTHSKAPSTRPSSSPIDVGRLLGCDSGEIKFQLTITTDDYPEESTWELASLDKSFVHTGGGYALPNTEYEEDFCIPDDGYIFSMNDKFGDGICCDSGQGSYTVTLNGKDIKSGGKFRQSETTDVMRACAGGEGRIMMEVNTDFFGSETSWTLNTMAGVELMSGSDYEAWDTAKDTMCLDSSACYSFTIRDRWGDGMCCSYGFGSYSVDFAGKTYGESFKDGYEETILVGASCPASTSSASQSGGRRHRHKTQRAEEKRASSYAQAHRV